MPQDEESAWRRHLRQLVAAGFLVTSVGSGVWLVEAPPAEDDVLRISAFNVQVFGKTKASKPDVMEVLARTARRFDVLAVQEIRNADRVVADRFLERINEEGEPRYAMVEGPRVGRTSAKEQIALYYDSTRVEVVEALTYPDSADRFEREPLVATLRADSLDLTLVAIHVKPDSAPQELEALEEVTDWLGETRPGERDIVVLGDLNADCDYLDEDGDDVPLRGDRWKWAIRDAWDTTTRSTDCTYDRIVLAEELAASEYVPESAHVFRFDSVFGLESREFVQSVSDHYPVAAGFRTSLVDDDP